MYNAHTWLSIACLSIVYYYNYYIITHDVLIARPRRTPPRNTVLLYVLLHETHKPIQRNESELQTQREGI